MRRPGHRHTPALVMQRTAKARRMNDQSVFSRVPGERLPERQELPRPASSPTSDVPIPESHRRAADRFAKLFRSVPLNDVEKLPDPDYL